MGKVVQDTPSAQKVTRTTSIIYMQSRNPIFPPAYYHNKSMATREQYDVRLLSDIFIGVITGWTNGVS